MIAYSRHPIGIRMIRVYRNILHSSVRRVDFSIRHGALTYDKKVVPTVEQTFMRCSQTLDILSVIYAYSKQVLSDESTLQVKRVNEDWGTAV